MAKWFLLGTGQRTLLIAAMIKTFALDPELFADFQHFLLLRDKFGVPEGRLIAKFPNKWKRCVREFCDFAVREGTLKEARRSTVIDWLANHGDRDPRLISTPAVWQEGLCWHDNASTNQQHFDLVVSASLQTQGKCLRVDEDCAYLVAESFASCGQQNVKRTAKALVDCVWSLAAGSKGLKIVEPHFSPELPRFRKPLIELIDRLHGAGLKPDLELHVCRIDKDGNDRFGAPMQRNYRDHLDPELPTGMKLTVYFWSHGSQRLHPRYLLTDVGGIKLDYGWDEAETAEEETPAILLNKGLWEEELAKYQCDPPGKVFQMDPAKHILRLG